MPVNIFRLEKNVVRIKPVCSGSVNTENLISEIREFISKRQYSNIILDLTDLNLLDSVRIGVLSSTHHFLEFLNGKIYLVVPDRQAKKSIDILNLSNAVVVYDRDQSLSLSNIA